MSLTKQIVKRKRNVIADLVTYSGWVVMRGLGMVYTRFDKLFEQHARADIDWPRKGQACFVVVRDRLEDSASDFPQVFTDRDVAVSVARAHSNGNINHRVLTVTDQLIVRATDNKEYP